MRTRLVRVRRKRKGLGGAGIFLVLAMAVYIWATVPAIREMGAVRTGAARGERVTREIRLKALECHMVSFGTFDTLHEARVEAARYVPRGAAGYILQADGFHVIGAGYTAREEADRVCAQLKAQEGIECRTITYAAEETVLRVTAGSEQIAAFLEGEEIVRSCAEVLGKLAFSVDRGKADAGQARDVIGAQKEKLQAAARRLDEQTAGGGSPLFDELRNMIGAMTERLEILNGESGAMALSSGLKHVHVEFRMRQIAMMNGLEG